MKYVLAGAGVVLLVIGISWWQASQASERFKQLEVEVKAAQKELEQKSAAAEQAAQRYEDLAARRKESEELYSRQMTLLLSQMQSIQADNARLRSDLRERERDTAQKVAQVSNTPDAQLAQEIQSEARKIKPASSFTWNDPTYSADRPAAEAIREGFLRMELAEFSVANQKQQIEGLESQRGNLESRLALEKAAFEECDIRESSCAAALQAAREARIGQAEIIRLREEQIAALQKKNFWGRLKRWGGWGAAFGAGYAVGQARR